MLKIIKYFTPAIFLVIVPLSTLSHPGHGDFNGTGMHYFTSAIHMLPIGIVLFALLFMLRSYIRSKRKESFRT